MRRILLGMIAVAACGPETGGESAGESTTTNTGATMSDEPTSTGGPPGEANIIFVTSTVHTGALGGVAAADAECAARAAAAGLPGDYVAWMSTPEQAAIDRVVGARGWVRPDGRPFADEPASLLDPTWYPPALDEFGQLVTDNSLALTGTGAMGEHVTVDCSGYTDDSGDLGLGGEPVLGRSGWFTGSSGRCLQDWRIYCLGIDHVVPVSLPATPGRVAFVSQVSPPTGGITAADVQCAAEAEAAGLPGSYRALLATAGASAASRFDLDGPPWRRVDGVMVFEPASTLTTGLPLAPLGLHADGQWEALTVRVGALDPGSPGTATCADWSGTAGESLGGDSDRVGPSTFGNLGILCDQASAVYCLQD